MTPRYLICSTFLKKSEHVWNKCSTAMYSRLKYFPTGSQCPRIIYLWELKKWSCCKCSTCKARLCSKKSLPSKESTLSTSTPTPTSASLLIKSSFHLAELMLHLWRSQSFKSSKTLNTEARAPGALVWLMTNTFQETTAATFQFTICTAQRKLPQWSNHTRAK